MRVSHAQCVRLESPVNVCINVSGGVCVAIAIQPGPATDVGAGGVRDRNTARTGDRRGGVAEGGARSQKKKKKDQALHGPPGNAPRTPGGVGTPL